MNVSRRRWLAMLWSSWTPRTPTHRIDRGLRETVTLPRSRRPPRDRGGDVEKRDHDLGNRESLAAARVLRSRRHRKRQSPLDAMIRTKCRRAAGFVYKPPDHICVVPFAI